jgi:hypothetical protein
MNSTHFAEKLGIVTTTAITERHTAILYAETQWCGLDRIRFLLRPGSGHLKSSRIVGVTSCEIPSKSRRRTTSSPQRFCPKHAKRSRARSLAWHDIKPNSRFSGRQARNLLSFCAHGVACRWDINGTRFKSSRFVTYWKEWRGRRDSNSRPLP